ncbi:hypothetical protein FGG08_003244 [Glutinoglossum americanum]|uniref:Glycosyltransferase 2-like domain-containing protein n=1 Tax=Glutinoglossum americanum TaxID=1670608 RepID=A0A9P8I310_9PEZI|nr:hypothetical protein FGG08_003244 [Glutinoglossum americanum]
MQVFKSYFQPLKEKSLEIPSPLPSPPWVSSAHTSRPSSIYPEGDFRNGAEDEIAEIKADVMVNWLHQEQMANLWANRASGEGVVLKKKRGVYSCCPPELRYHDGGFFDAIESMNVQVAITVQTRVIKLFLRNRNVPFVPLLDGLRLQILPTMQDLQRAQKNHFAAFIADVAMLVVWDDEPRHVLVRTARIEKQLMEMIWKDNSPWDEKTYSKNSPSTSITEVGEIDAGSGVSIPDLEEALVVESRPTVLIQSILTGVTLAILIAALGNGWKRLALQTKVDGAFVRLALVTVVPAQIFLSLTAPELTISKFFMQSVAGCLAQLCGPISQLSQNSKYYSAKPPRRLRRDQGALPHVTIQMPVYKEGLHAVIEPTIKSVKAAMSTYGLQGGTANIFINDDGMQLLSEEDAEARKGFYHDHNIGWVARPRHNSKPKEGEQLFLRRGKFKKASNMNYALMVSNRIEEKLERVHRVGTWTQEDEDEAYMQCLREVLDEDDGRTWAAGNTRMGDYILLIDSDTRIPEDSFLDAVSEMENSPEVAIIQFASGVMNVTTSFFENGITFFTNLIYTAIKFAVANGDIAPFVGHNAILRWSAIQQIGYEDEDGYEKYWSESTVSEDFDMALRLQTNGHIIRLAAYAGDGYKEGVSLTVYDELARWEKYAYGCNELIFHPIRYWLTRGPLTPLFLKFIGSNMPLPSKITIIAYIGTYYAIGSAWILTLANYFLMGWFVGHLDKYYLDSFQVYFSIVIVFNTLGNISLAVLRYRLEEKSLFAAWRPIVGENFRWIFLMTIFLGGVSIHVSQALLCHMFGIDMTWGATAKEVEDTTFFEEIPKVMGKFKYTFLFCILCTAGMIAGAFALPPLWRIDTFVAIWPLVTIVFSHFFLPIALNPALMLFTW